MDNGKEDPDYDPVQELIPTRESSAPWSWAMQSERRAR